MDNKFLYNHIKNYSVLEVMNNARVGFIFEFFTSKDLAFILEDLSRITGKAVTVTNDEKIQPSWSNAILLREYEGKSPKYKLYLAQQDYLSIDSMLHGILNWIKESCKTDKTTGLNVSLSFNNGSLKTIRSISNMDVAKMILKIDENYLYNRFPDREGSPFSMTVKKFIPVNEFVNISHPFQNLNNSFQMPNSSYYGIDFSDQTMGILRFNYIGGKGYENKGAQINEALKYYIISTYQVLNIPEYSKDMEYQMGKILEDYSIIRRCYYDPEFFLKEFKEIQVGVDLKTGDQIIKTFWPKLRNPLTKLMMESGFKKGKFNLDLEQGVCQIKDAKLFGIKISNMQIVNCEIQGVLERCSLWNSKSNNSRFIKSTLVEGNNINESYLEKTRADRGNTISKCVITNSGEIINCKVNESIIKNAGLGKEAKVDEHCVIIGDKLYQQPIVKNIKPEEIRDYSWIKNLTPSESNKEFGNIFKIKW